MNPQFRDHPRRGGALVAHLVYLTGLALATGGAVLFALILVGAMVGEEAFGGTYRPFDPLVRVGIGVVALVVVLGIGLASFGIAFRRAATALQVEREFADRPERVPTWADRRDLEVESAFGGTYVFAGFFIGLNAFAILLLIFAVVETARYNPESAAEGAVIIGVMVVLEVIAVGLTIAVRSGLQATYRDAAANVLQAWGRVRGIATAEEKKRRPGDVRAEYGLLHRWLGVFARRTSRISGIALGVGFAVFMAGVYLRQPCRLCDERYWERPVENVIDLLMVVGGPLMLAGAVLGALDLLAALLVRVIERARLRRWLAEGAFSPKVGELVPHLTEDGPLMRVGLAVVGVALPPIAVLGVALVQGADPAFGTVIPVLVAAGLVGVVLMAWSVGADARLRERIRETWWPGDPAPPPRSVTRSAGRSTSKA